MKIILKILNLFIILIFILSVFYSISGENNSTIVKIIPKKLQVNQGDSFDINISIFPDQSIRAVELKLSFNSSLLSINFVNEGNLFDGFSTIFNSGDIDNENGILMNVYSTILGKGNISKDGTYLTINFSTKQKNGTSNIFLFDVVVVNESDSIPVEIENGLVMVGDFSSDNENNKPTNPDLKINNNSGFVDVYYNISFFSFDSENDKIYYFIDWGDGTSEEWIGPFESGEIIMRNHSWSEPGLYELKVKSKDVNNYESDWSEIIFLYISDLDDLYNISTIDVDFVFYPENPVVDENIYFQDLSSIISGNITQWFWNFGDNNYDNIKNPNHFYNKSGFYNISLVVISDNGLSNSTMKNIFVSEDVKIDDNNENNGFFNINWFFLLILSFMVLSFIFYICYLKYIK